MSHPKRRRYSDYVMPRTIVGAAAVAAGTYAGLTGLAEIIQDIITKVPVETPDKVVTALGAGLITYGLGVLTETIISNHYKSRE